MKRKRVKRKMISNKQAKKSRKSRKRRKKKGGGVYWFNTGRMR
jgi:hypothetical protein